MCGEAERRLGVARAQQEVTASSTWRALQPAVTFGRPIKGHEECDLEERPPLSFRACALSLTHEPKTHTNTEGEFMARRGVDRAMYITSQTNSDAVPSAAGRPSVFFFFFFPVLFSRAILSHPNHSMHFKIKTRSPKRQSVHAPWYAAPKGWKKTTLETRHRKSGG